MTHFPPAKPNIDTTYYASQLSAYEKLIHPFKICLLDPEILQKIQEFHDNAIFPAPSLVSPLSSLYFSSKKAQFCKLTLQQFQKATEMLKNTKPLSMDLASVLCSLFLCHRKQLDQMHYDSSAPIYFLDLCSSPGMKLCVASLLFRELTQLRFVAVDISKDRLILTKKMFKLWNKDSSIRLMRHDGTLFVGGAFERSHKWEPNTLVWEGGAWYQDWIGMQRQKKGTRTGMVKDAAKKDGTPHGDSLQPRKKRKLNTTKRSCTPELHPSGSAMEQRARENPTHYDFVMIDAECTTDGSIKHVFQYMQKYDKTVEDFLQERCNEDQVRETATLQKKLLHNGYKLLKPGGYLLYSTCSLMRDQNEDVVSWLLGQYPNSAKLVDPFQHSVLADAKQDIVYEDGKLKHTLRFNPQSTGTNGLFVAKIFKSR
uniref:SAM-dependent MTase RsmB/NOP-type domain-containing protein n=1 Tax=Percolomonas cosmopolitus TaxID=63605 RepID=A0A6U0KLV3_9EUKA|mmetsp:Transcript_4756/g.17834  ORF Transcript_4756/g.17834 Transcript_4756/m.17834 type:complete len:426 (+) Transcript_4756:1032-2309(+)